MNFLSVGNKFKNLSNSKAVVLKVPYEMTTSYGLGSDKGPEAIVKASTYVELFDEELNVKPHTVGISTQQVTDFTSDHEKNLELIGKNYVKYLGKDRFVIALGGEHSITIGIVGELTKKVRDLSVVQFDAHTDLRNFYQKSNYSHACTMRRVYDMTPKIAQVGIRSFSESEFNFMKKKNLKPITAFDMENMKDDDLIDKTLGNLSDNVYITFDVDYFALDIVSDTGTPEPGGPGWYKTLRLLRGIFEKKNVIGMDVVELVGRNDDDSSNVSAFSAALLVKKCITYKFFAGGT
jgi:agmatinase